MDSYQEIKSPAGINVIRFPHIAWMRLRGKRADSPGQPEVMTVEILTAAGWNSLDLPKEEAINFVQQFKKFSNSKLD